MTAAEADMGLVYGIGFPPFRGELRFVLSTRSGVAEFVALADKYAIWALCTTPDRLREMAKNGQSFFG